MERKINDQNFEEILAEGLPVVVDFSATWCGPCQRIAPYFEQLAETYAGKVIIGKCDVDEAELLPARFGVRNVPTVLFIKNGEVVDKNVGAAPMSVFVEKIEALLK
ncbi:MAG: thioredoxin [Prevotellaceae bacterium]|nr:thioredoxin [Prevotellaceae bacterium]